jgi:hypothetical protein
VRPITQQEPRAIDKAVALMTSIDGPMTEPCSVCHGGIWVDGREIIAAVHTTGCPHSEVGRGA